ncbi:hypothetical protein EU803_13435 [Loktanella sp. IMCC34160]|nr:hypothetical protein EU803_13435 [Loktanella sp. IMCC34160]
MKRDNRIGTDTASSDLVFYGVAFVLGAGAALYVLVKLAGLPVSSPLVIVAGMFAGFGASVALARLLAARRSQRATVAQAEQQALRDAETERQLKAMQKDRFEKGLGR